MTLSVTYRHEGNGTNASLNIFASQALQFDHLFKRGVGWVDGNLAILNAKVFGQQASVDKRVHAGIARGQPHSEHIFGPDSLHGNRGADRRVDAATQTQDDSLLLGL